MYRGKVIKWFEMCDIYTGDLCQKNNCPYFWDGCRDKLKKDILAMLKEQEPKQVEAEVINEIDRLYRCPSCHISMILRNQPYCHSCGQAVKWE